MKLFSTLTTVAFSYEQPKYRDFLDALNQKKSGWGAPAGRIAALYTLCEPLETPVNGQVVCDQSTCALVCDQGYVAVGRRRTKCRFNPHKVFFWKRLLGECDTCLTDLAAPPAGITVTCGFNVLNRKKCTYKCANGEKLQVENGETYQLTTVCTCPRWNNRNCGWNARKLGRMITDADVGALTCPGVATTTPSSPVVTTTAAPPVVSTTAAPTTTAATTSLSCGDISSFESNFVDGTFTCDSSADSCTAACTDSSLFPFPTSVVGCNAGEITPTDASSMTFTCKATSCGDPADFNYGQNWGDVTAACSGETCSLTCDGDASRPVPYPVSEVSCSNGALTPSGGSEIYCAETSCGRLEDFYNVDNTGLTSSCTADSCSLSCSAGEMPTYLTLQCDTASSTYQHVHNSQSEMVECVPEYDTPCGQIEAAFTIDESTFNITCSGMESFYQTTAVTCDLTCADPTHALVGESTIVCENSQFTNAGSEIRCDPPPTKTCVSFPYQNTALQFADAEVVCANLGGYLPFFKDLITN